MNDGLAQVVSPWLDVERQQVDDLGWTALKERDLLRGRREKKKEGRVSSNWPTKEVTAVTTDSVMMFRPAELTLRMALWTSHLAKFSDIESFWYSSGPPVPPSKVRRAETDCRRLRYIWYRSWVW